MESFLRIQREANIVIWTMDQASTRNALTGNTAVEEIVAACEAAAADHSIRAVILTGAGKIFSSGGNLKDMLRYQTERYNAAQVREEYRSGIQRMPKALYNLDVPTIAAVNGPAIGAGLDLATMCDIRIAAESARFAESFVKLGIVPGDGGAWLLPRAIGMSRACELAFSGDSIDATQAAEWGLVSRVVPDDQLLEEARSIGQRIAANPAGVLRLTKRLLREGERNSLDSLLELSASFQAHAHQTADHHEAVRAFIEKRPPRFGQ